MPFRALVPALAFCPALGLSCPSLPFLPILPFPYIEGECPALSLGLFALPYGQPASPALWPALPLASLPSALTC